MALPKAVFTTGEDVQSYPRLRVEGYNGYAIYTGKTYPRLTVSGSLLADATINGEFTNFPLIESLRVTARKGEPISFTVTWIKNNATLPNFTPANKLSDLQIYCGDRGYEYTATVTTGYRYIPCGNGEIWVERVSGTIETLGGSLEGDRETILGTNVTVAVAITETGTAANMRWGKNNFNRYDVVGADGVPMSEPIPL